MIIKGQNITEVYTLGSGYDNGKIGVSVGDKLYRMDIKELMKFNTDFNALRFKVVKKRVHEYLEVI